MASSPADRSPADRTAVATTPVGFALQELIACWDQAYEALVRGDLERVEALLAVAQDHVGKTGDPAQDSPQQARLRSEAASAHGRLVHGMKAGLVGIQEELALTRRGAKAIRGYIDQTLGLGGNVVKSV